MITIVCPKCNTELKPELSSMGKSLQCPKCNNIWEVKSQKDSPLVLDDPDKEPDEGIRPVFAKSEIKKIKKIECDDYLLFYDSQDFGVKGSKGETRFPLCSQLAIAYFFKSVFLKVSLRIISQFIIIPFTLLACGSPDNLMLHGGVKNDVGLDVYVMFWIAKAFLFVTIVWLIFDYKKYGFHPEGALQVLISIGGETKKFTFKKDKKKAIDFFLEIERLAHSSNP